MASIQASDMVTIGVDPHPDSHTAAALEGNGKLLGSITVVNDKAGMKKLKHWSVNFSSRRWAIEGAGNTSYGAKTKTCGKNAHQEAARQSSWLTPPNTLHDSY